MKLKYLGTAAAEAFPALGCNCDTCMRARAAGGKNIRTRSQAIIDDSLLIDFPADTVWHFMQYNINFLKIHSCIITHSHSDHLYPADIDMLGKGFCATDRAESLHFYAADSGYKLIKPHTDAPHVSGRADLTEYFSYQKFNASGYTVLPLPANHDPSTSPHVLHIRKGNKSLLYGNDSGILCDKAFTALEKEGRLDLVSLDCTGSFLKGWRDNHLCFETCLEVFENMRQKGIIDNKTIKVIHHFSHNSLATYDDLVPVAAKHGILVSYDGMEVEI